MRLSGICDGLAFHWNNSYKKIYFLRLQYHEDAVTPSQSDFDNFVKSRIPVKVKRGSQQQQQQLLDRRNEQIYKLEEYVQESVRFRFFPTRHNLAEISMNFISSPLL